MAVELTGTSKLFVGTGVLSNYSPEFYASDAAQVQVFVNGVLQTLGDNYTLAGLSASAGISVSGVFLTGAAVLVQRRTPITQEVDTQNNETILEDVLDGEFDKLTMIDQEQQEQITDVTNRAILVPKPETGFTLAPVAARLGGGKVIAPNPTTGAIEVQAIDAAYRGPAGPANSTYPDRITMAAAANPTNLSAIIVGDGTFAWRAGDWSALIAALPADFIASTRPGSPLGAWIRIGEGVNSLAAMALGSYTLGQVVPSLVYGGSTWIAKANPILLQNPESLQAGFGTEIDFSDQIHILANKIGGGTVILECQLGSIAGYVRQRYTETYGNLFARGSGKDVIPAGSPPPVQGPPITAYCYGDSITYGQLAAGGPFPTGFGDGSQHTWTKITSPWPETMVSIGSPIFGAGKFAAVNKGFSGDRVGSAYRRHRFQGAYNIPTVSFVAYGTNDCLFATQNGFYREGLFVPTIAGSANSNGDFLFEKFIPAYRKFLFREVLRGGLPICLAPYVFSSVAGEQDGTTWNAGKIVANFRAAIRMAADEIGALCIDLADVTNLYPNATITHDGIHPNNDGAYIIAAAAMAPLVGLGWRSACVVREGSQLLPLVHLHNIGGLGGPSGPQLSFLPNTGSYGQAFTAADAGADYLLDTNSMFFSVYLDDEEIDYMPVMSINNGVALQWQSDLGRLAPRSRLNTVRGVAGLPALTTTNASYNNVSGSSKVLNHPGSSGISPHATLRGRGYHLITVTPLVGVSVLHGIVFGRFNKAAAVIADPTGGATIDAQSRTAVTAILNALRDQGIIKT